MNVLPMDSERVVTGQTVLVRGGRIVRVGPVADVRPAAGATVVDGVGKFLMPGVAEMHGHYPNPAERQFTDVLFLYVANGVTLVRGMQGGPTHLPLRASIASGETLGPRLFVCAPSMTGNSVKTAGDAERMVREAKSAGFDHLKVHEGLTPEVYAAIAKTANESGVTTGSFLSSDGLVLAEWVWGTGLNDGHDHVVSSGGNPGAYEQGHGQEFQGLRFSNVGGGAITLTSFDMQGQWWVSSMNDGSGTLYSAPLVGGWVTMTPGFTATPYVYIYASVPGAGIVGPAGWLDNVVLNQTVPEPATLLLLGAGLLTGMRRYRRPRT